MNHALGQGLLPLIVIRMINVLRGDFRAFTLVEVLVALIIAAILASGLLALQQHGLNRSRQAEVLWMHLNIAQESLMGHNPGRGDRWQNGSPGVLNPDGSSAQIIGITMNPPTSERPSPWMTLTTRLEGRELKWSWPLTMP